MKVLLRGKTCGGAVGVCLLLICFTAAASTLEGAETAGEGVLVRLGWQIPAVTQAGIVQVMKRTNLAAQHGLELSLIPFSYGTPEIEAALAGELDVIFAGDQPVINLLARGGRWSIVARLYYDRVSVIVPKSSAIGSVGDLAGKIVASPFGSVAHREIILSERSAGLTPGEDITNIDRDILDIRQSVLSGGADGWQGFDAASVWEPHVSSFDELGLTASLTENRTIGVIAMSDAFIAAQPEASVQLLAATLRAWAYLARHTAQVMQWYIDDSQLDYSPELLEKAVSIDPNLNASTATAIDLSFSEKDIGELARHAAWGVESRPDGREVELLVDTQLLSRAVAQVKSGKAGELQVILPSMAAVEAAHREQRSAIDSFPLLAVFGGVVLLAMSAIQLGLWLGRRHEPEQADEIERPISTVVAAVLGMMAFVIALTFGAANSRFDARKEALLQDVISIKTAYLRAELLPEPHRSTIRSLLRDYTQARAGIVYAYRQPETLRLVQRHADTLQRSMWSHVESMAAAQGNSRTYLLFASALNDVFNLHTKRVVLGAYYRIPAFVWIVLVFAACVAMLAVGFQFGIGGRRRSYTAELALSVTFALVMLLAFDLDRAGEGYVTVNQQPMIDLYQELTRRR